MSYLGYIDTDAGIGTILSNFSTEYINHVIDDSLSMRFRPFDGPMPNMVDVLNRQFAAIIVNSPDYKEKILETREETFKEIILRICKFYNLTFTGDFENMSNEEIKSIAEILYDIFIARFTEHMLDFIVQYIIDNAESLYNSLRCDETTVKPKESSNKFYIDYKFAIIHANINKVIYDMAAYDIPLSRIVSYSAGPVLAPSILMMISDNNDIYKNYYASFIRDNTFYASIVTSVKLRLQTRTQSDVDITSML